MRTTIASSRCSCLVSARWRSRLVSVRSLCPLQSFYPQHSGAKLTLVSRCGTNASLDPRHAVHPHRQQSHRLPCHCPTPHIANMHPTARSATQPVLRVCTSSHKSSTSPTAYPQLCFASSRDCAAAITVDQYQLHMASALRHFLCLRLHKLLVSLFVLLQLNFRSLSCLYRSSQCSP